MRDINRGGGQYASVSLARYQRSKQLAMKVVLPILITTVSSGGNAKFFSHSATLFISLEEDRTERTN